jgi:chemotaxis protein MotB
VLGRSEAEEAAAAVSVAEATADDLRARLAAALEEAAASGEAEAAALTEAERRAALLATAEDALAAQEEISAEALREGEALALQVAELSRQVAGLQDLLDASASAEAEAGVQIEALGAELNAALARVAQEERARADAEAGRNAALAQVAEEERRRADEEAARAASLESYRSEFFGQVRAAVEGREGIEIVGDRFVFSSAVLFPPASATLSPEGLAQVAEVASLLREVAGAIPPAIDWIIRVDGHTDDAPLSGEGRFADNWELSQARALSVVRALEAEGIPPRRLAANGFGEWQPLDTSGTLAARDRNRRIEIKLTER